MSLIEKIREAYQAAQREVTEEIAEMLELSAAELEYVAGGMKKG